MITQLRGLRDLIETEKQRGCSIFVDWRLNDLQKHVHRCHDPVMEAGLTALGGVRTSAITTRQPVLKPGVVSYAPFVTYVIADAGLKYPSHVLNAVPQSAKQLQLMITQLRRWAEQTLHPVVIWVDPSLLLGAFEAITVKAEKPELNVGSDTSDQRYLFGEHRPLIPNWFEVNRHYHTPSVERPWTISNPCPIDFLGREGAREGLVVIGPRAATVAGQMAGKNCQAAVITAFVVDDASTVNLPTGKNWRLIETSKHLPSIKGWLAARLGNRLIDSFERPSVSDPSSNFPKRQVWLNELKRDFPRNGVPLHERNKNSENVAVLSDNLNTSSQIEETTPQQVACFGSHFLQVWGDDEQGLMKRLVLDTALETLIDCPFRICGTGAEVILLVNGLDDPLQLPADWVEMGRARQIMLIRQDRTSGSKRTLDWESVTEFDRSNLVSPPVAATDLQVSYWGAQLQPRLGGEVHQLWRDPCSDIGIKPAGMHGFLQRWNCQQAVIDPKSCSGCSRCWTSCPEGAIHATVLETPQVLAWAFERWSLDSSMITPAKRLMPKIGQILDQSNWADPAGVCDRIMGSAKLDEDKRPLIHAFWAKVLDQVTALPRVSMHDGLQLFIDIEGTACTACGLCVQVCADRAISLETRTLTSFVRDMPETSGANIAALEEKQDWPSLACRMLAHSIGLVSGSGGITRSGSGTRLALRLLATSIEYCEQVSNLRWLEEIGHVRDQVQARIDRTLKEAVSSCDHRELLLSLRSGRDQREPLSQLVARLELSSPKGSFDMDALNTWLDYEEKLNRLIQNRENSGPTWFMVADRDLDLSEFMPINASVWVSEAEDMAAVCRGIWRGLAHRYLSEVNLVRRCKLALEEGPKAASVMEDSLEVGDLADHEKSSVPRLLLLLGENGMNQFVSDLGRGDFHGVPFVVGSLAESASRDERVDMSAMPFPFVRASLDQPGVIGDAVTRAYHRDGPTVIHIFVPEPHRLGVATDQTLILAAQAREQGLHADFAETPVADDRQTSDAIVTPNPALSVMSDEARVQHLANRLYALSRRVDD